MQLDRFIKHLLTTRWQVQRAFPRRTLDAIEAAIRAGEAQHGGEIRFAVEGALDGRPLFEGQSARGRAIDVFSQLRVWDTENNNGLLIYVLLADRAVEIVADRGIDTKVGSDEWSAVCHEMETAFRQANHEAGVVAGVQAVTRHLAAHFPAAGQPGNELPDAPVVLQGRGSWRPN
ncbi:MAG: TPM domain-containing protein [Betaproteobacteria bacterium]